MLLQFVDLLTTTTPTYYNDAQHEIAIYVDWSWLIDSAIPYSQTRGVAQSEFTGEDLPHFRKY